MTPHSSPVLHPISSGPVRLNLGSGADRHDGYVSVDLRPEIADVVADVRDLPWPDGSIAEMLALDCLEHLPPNQTIPTLTEWRRVLADGGTLTVRVPNLDELCRTIIDRGDAGQWGAVEVLIRNIYGGHKYGPDGELDHHCTGWTPALFDMLLRRTGFEPLTNDLALNMTVEARKPVSELADKIRTVSVKKVSQAADQREKRLDADLDAYRRLRWEGLQPPTNDGCARLEAEAVSRVEIEQGVVRSDMEPSQRREWARAMEELTEP